MRVPLSWFLLGLASAFESHQLGRSSTALPAVVLPSRRAFLAAGVATTSLTWIDPAQAEEATRAPLLPYASVRRSKTLRLSNGLEVLLVTDRRASRATAALTVGGAGQFADTRPGMAHLLEHLILSTRSRRGKNQDFEDWLGDQEGASNGFTAYDCVCFHFSCPPSVLPEALERFAGLFVQPYVEKVCRNRETLKREIRRVDSELDFENAQSLYLTKDFVNPEHPYSRFSAGSQETLEGVEPAELIAFFEQKYQASQTTLVVVSPQESLERLVTPFAATMSRVQPRSVPRRSYPGGFLDGNRFKQMVLYHPTEPPTIGTAGVPTEKLSLQWSFNWDYEDMMKKYCVTAPQIAFLLSQSLCRRGPGSLYAYLLRRGYVPGGGSGVPRVVLPVDVSRFQILKLELTLTLEGFANRALVVAAVYDSLALLQRGLSRELLAQYATIAKLHAYSLAPRPPDAVELAVDSQLYGLPALAAGTWYRYPEDRQSLNLLSRTFGTTLEKMIDPSNALVIATAGPKAFNTPVGILGEKLPALSSSRWLIEPVTGGKFCFQDMMRLSARVEQLVLTRLVSDEELLQPSFNPLVPTMLRPARKDFAPTIFSNAQDRIVYNTPDDNDDQRMRRARDDRTPNTWTLLDPRPEQEGLALPRAPPEATCRCAFVLQLLSPRPARADIRQAAQAELWKLSFEVAVMDLAELGAPGGLAYDVSFNKFGLRLTFLGISQNLPSYARRLCRRLVKHHFQLLDGPEIFPRSLTTAAVNSANRAPNISPQRRRRIVSSLRRSTAYEAATEGIAFLRSCNGAVCFAQGDLLSKEANDLVGDLQQIFASSSGTRGPSAVPDISDLLYRPMWKPRGASSCTLPGMALLSDACGRLPR